MKTITPSMRDHLDGELTSMCTCWRITRRDGEVFAFTDHDAPLMISGQLYKASTGFTRSAIASDATLSADNMEIDGFLDDESITEDDLRFGLFDYADVEVFAVNWNDLSDGIIRLRKGVFGEIQVQASGLFKVELRGLTQLFAQTVGEIYAPECRTDLGSEKCGMVINAPAYVLNTSYGLNARARVVFDDLRYGYRVPLINAGATIDIDSYEGNPLGWTSIWPVQLYPTRQNVLFTPHDGTYSFQPKNQNWYWQNIPFSRLPPQDRPDPAKIDAGAEHRVTFRLWVTHIDENANSLFGISWLDGSNQRLTIDPEGDPDMTDSFPPDVVVMHANTTREDWTEVEVTGVCPPGTRAIRLSFKLEPIIGGNTPVVYIDSMTCDMTVATDDGSKIVTVPLINGDAEALRPNATVPGWTHRTNTMSTAQSNLNVKSRAGGGMFLPRGDEWFWQDVSVSSTPGIDETKLQEGKYLIEFAAYTNNTEAGHRARVGVRFFDASMNRIMPRASFDDLDMRRDVPNDAESDLRHNPELRRWERRSITAPIPPNTQIIRYCVYRDADPEADVITPSMYIDDMSAIIWDEGHEQVEALVGASNWEILAIKAGMSGLNPPDWSLLQNEGDTVADGSVIWRLTLAPYIHTGTVSEVINRNVFKIAGLPEVPRRTSVKGDGTYLFEDFPVSQYQVYRYGLLHFESGLNKGARIEIKNWDHATKTVTAWLPFLRPINIGDTVSIWVGCGKNIDECSRKFNNVLNFRGEPEVPGQDQYFKIGGAP